MFGAIAFFVGGMLLSGVQSGSWEWWQSFGKPEAGAMRFWGIKPNHNNHTVQVYVETARGIVYSCCSNPSGSWEEAKSPIDKGSSTCAGFQDPTSKQRTFSNLPGKIVDCTRMMWSWEWVANDDFFVILEDGSVWKWNYYNSPGQIIPFLCEIPIAAVILGCFIAVTAGKRVDAEQRRKVEAP